MPRQQSGSPPEPQGRQSLRIIGGKWRGRKLAFVTIDGLRPTGDRIRETLFNWLAPDIVGARCLDMFAGSGALGIEALSRGAGWATLIDADKSAVASMRQHLKMLAADNAHVLEGDGLRLAASDAPWDLVFVDPPFAANLWQAAIDALNSTGMLAPEATVYVESGPEADYQVPGHWYMHREKRTPNLCCRLYYTGN
ncbi:MAG TPA: 16S rRNA (guanine(966)-N(2))-methyltransferase RsmD [Cellvibrionaceae bacterium]